MAERRVVTPEELAELIRSGEIDTVLTVFADLQGRLMGKRVTGHFYLDHYLAGAILFGLFVSALNGVFLGFTLQATSSPEVLRATQNGTSLRGPGITRTRIGGAMLWLSREMTR